MLFKSELVSKTWDTWMAFHEGRFYLYYLTSETAPSDGFGVAVSEDGLHWRDYGRVLAPSEKMVRYLGADSVWKEVGYPSSTTPWIGLRVERCPGRTSGR